jgi:hypothetical protein
LNDALKLTLTNIKEEIKKCTYTGDFNLDLLKYDTHNPTNDFINLNSALSFLPLINKPTRITINSATLIDNCFTNILELNTISSVIIPSDISDHYPILLTQHDNIPNKDIEYKMKRTFNNNITYTGVQRPTWSLH